MTRKASWIFAACLLALLAGWLGVVWRTGGLAGRSQTAVVPPPPVSEHAVMANLLEDGWVEGGRESVNHDVKLQVKDSGAHGRTAFLKFEVNGVKGFVTAATLRLYVTKSQSGKQVSIYAADNDWTEDTLTWSHRPALRGDPVATVELPADDGSYVDFDMTEYVSGTGVFSFAVTGDSSQVFEFNAKEVGSGPPLLEVSGDETISRLPTDVMARGDKYISRYSAPADVTNVGYFDVTKQPYGARGDGVTDDTPAIQRAINEARDARVVVFFPAGTYKVTDTLSAVQGLVKQQNVSGEQIRMRAFPNVLTGPRQGERAVIRLAPGAPGFDDAAHPKPLVYFWSRGTGVGRESASENKQGVNYNQKLLDVDLDLAGNAGAIGVEHAAAQGSSIEDVAIRATGAYAGVRNAPGAGGGIQGLTVTGGRYGMYIEEGQLSVISDITLNDQSDAAIYYQGRGSLQAVGVTMKGAGIVCESTGTPWTGNISLIDSVVDLTKPGIAIRTPRNVYISNSYFRQAATLIDLTDNGVSYAKQPGNAAGWAYVQEYAAGTTVLQSPAWSGAATEAAIPKTATPVPGWVDGVKTTKPVVDMINPYAGSIPVDLQSRHAWTKPFPSWQDADTTNVKTAYGAKGDGAADDTAAIQQAIDHGGKVFLPRGTYRISRPLTLQADTKLFGIGNVQTQIVPILTGADSAYRDSDRPQPIVRTANDPEATTTLAFLALLSPRTSNAVYAIQWEAGRRSIVRDIDITYGKMGTKATEKLRHALVSIEGNGGGKWYGLWNADFIPGSEAPEYRRLTVRNTMQPLAFYMLNLEHAVSDYQAEFVDSRNIDVFSYKAEGNKPLVKIDRSAQIRMVGIGGIASPFAGTAAIQLDNSEEVTLANLMFQQRKPGEGSLQAFEGIAVDPSSNFVVKEVTAGERIGTPGNEQVILYKRGR